MVGTPVWLCRLQFFGQLVFKLRSIHGHEIPSLCLLPSPPLTPPALHSTAWQLMLTPFSVLRLWNFSDLSKTQHFLKCSPHFWIPSPVWVTLHVLNTLASLPHWVLPGWVSSPVAPVLPLITVISLPSCCAFDSPNFLLSQTCNYLQLLLNISLNKSISKLHNYKEKTWKHELHPSSIWKGKTLTLSHFQSKLLLV